jgi:6-phosphogluconolactonase
MSTAAFVFFGTYTTTTSAGIYVFAYDSASGALTERSTLGGHGSPSFLARHPILPVLYAVHELDAFDGQPQGALTAMRFDPSTGALTVLNTLSTNGLHPCHVSVDRTGRFAFAANYSSGSVAMYALAVDGALHERCDFVQHRGAGPNVSRQEGPHAHQTVVGPDNRFLYVNDLGTDQVMIYAIDAAAGKLRPHGYARIQGGAGPRHIDFSPDGRNAYVINELDNTLNAFAVAPDGSLRELQSLSTLPAGYSEVSYCADVHVSADGRFVYGSNRGHNSIAAFARDLNNGLLTAQGRTPTGGAWPRNFALAPGGRVMLVTNQESDDVFTFDVDAATGALKRRAGKLSIPRPVCALFAHF